MSYNFKKKSTNFLLSIGKNVGAGLARVEFAGVSMGVGILLVLVILSFLCIKAPSMQFYIMLFINTLLLILSTLYLSNIIPFKSIMARKLFYFSKQIFPRKKISNFTKTKKRNIYKFTSSNVEVYLTYPLLSLSQSLKNNSKNYSKKITYRTMLSRAAKTGSEMVPVVLQTTLKTYASYAVNNLATPKDEGHPPIAKQSCVSEVCNISNCVNDNSKCDNETQTTAIVGHLTHSEKGVIEKDREVYKIDEEHFAVIYDTESQKIDHLYTEMRYAETTIIQQEDVTNVLNNATTNINKVEESKNENEPN